MRNLLTAIGMITMVGAAAGVSAQTPAAKDQTTMKGMNMTVAGCVTAGKTEGQFMLTNATKAGGAMDKKEPMDHDKMAKPGAEKPGTPGAEKMTKPGADTMAKPGMGGDHHMTFELVGGTNIKAHVGHQVEVTGTVSKADMDHMTAMGKEKPASGMAMPATKLNVTAVKMISTTCSK